MSGLDSIPFAVHGCCRSKGLGLSFNFGDPLALAEFNGRLYVAWKGKEENDPRPFGAHLMEMCGHSHMD
jgi:hypothetical protein